MILSRPSKIATTSLSQIRRRSGRRAARPPRRRRYTDLRSDTVTRPCPAMLAAATSAPLGDDVLGEDPTVNRLQDATAARFGKDAALWLPTGTQANLAAIMAHCHERAGEAIVGKESHIALWEGGNVATVAGVHPRQVAEDRMGRLDLDDVRDAWRLDDDDHLAKTALVCVENSHNMHGGAALDKAYLDSLGVLARDLGIRVHVDGARIFNASVSLGTPVGDLCAGADSVSVCLSKGLGAPSEFSMCT